MNIQIIAPKQPLFRLGNISDSDWRNLGMQARSEILARTSRQGVDINHQPFAPYSPTTIAKKESIMQQRTRFGAEHVSLEDTGQMHRSLSIEVKGQSVELYYADQNRARVALAHQTGGYRLPQRVHFGFNETDGSRYAQKIANMQAVANQRANK